MEPYKDEPHDYCFTEVDEFQQIPVDMKGEHNIRCISFFEHLICMVYDEEFLFIINVLDSWKKIPLRMELEQMNNLKMVKVNHNFVMLIAVKFCLYEVVFQPKLKLKLVEEVLAWDYSTH